MGCDPPGGVNPQLTAGWLLPVGPDTPAVLGPFHRAAAVPGCSEPPPGHGAGLGQRSAVFGEPKALGVDGDWGWAGVGQRQGLGEPCRRTP